MKEGQRQKAKGQGRKVTRLSSTNKSNI